MAKSPRKVKKSQHRPAQAVKRGPKRVWHIFRFKERFELPDDVRYCRRSPLQYTRDYVGSGQDDEAISYQQQMSVLKSRANRLQLRGAFHDLKEIAANRSRCYRGYLLNAKFEPATTKKIAQWLGLGTRQAGKLLRELEDIGLIEQVDLPKFDLSTNDEPPKEKKGGGKGKKGKPKTGKRGTKKTPKGQIPDNPGRARKALRAKNETANGNGNDNGKGNLGEKETAKTAPTKSAPEEAEETTEHHSGREPPNLRLHQGLQAETPSSPAATPPSLPSDSDAGGDMPNTGNSGHPPSSAFRQPQRLGAVLETMSDGSPTYSSEAKEFGEKIFEAIGVKHSPISPEGRRELGNFASAWTQAVSGGLLPTQITELWDKSVKDAQKINRQRGKKTFKRSAEAVWRYQFNARLSKMTTTRKAV